MQQRRYNNCPPSLSVFNSGQKVLKVPQSNRTDITVSGIHKYHREVKCGRNSRENIVTEKRENVGGGEWEVGRKRGTCVGR